MSRRAKVTFAIAVTSAAIVVPYVHRMQDEQREALRLGPVKDAQRRLEKLRPLNTEQKGRAAEYEEQKRLREEYSAQQQVSDVSKLEDQK